MLIRSASSWFDIIETLSSSSLECSDLIGSLSSIMNLFSSLSRFLLKEGSWDASVPVNLLRSFFRTTVSLVLFQLQSFLDSDEKFVF